MNIGNLEKKIFHFQEAILNYKKIIELNKLYDLAYYNLGVVYSTIGKFKLAEDYYKKAIEINPRYYKAYSNILFNLEYANDKNISHYLNIAKSFRSSIK